MSLSIRCVGDAILCAKDPNFPWRDPWIGLSQLVLHHADEHCEEVEHVSQGACGEEPDLPRTDY